MYRVMMVSGPVKRDFECGFETEEAAEASAEYYNYRWYDENGFEWRLEVEEYEEPIITKPKLPVWKIPRNEWANTFLKFQRTIGDSSALQYLSDTMENCLSKEERLKYRPIRRLVDACMELNVVIFDMEDGDIEHDSVIDAAYRNLIQRLIEIAENS